MQTPMYLLIQSNQTTRDSLLIPMTITTPGPPIAQKAYRLPLTKRKIVEEVVQDMLPHDIIESSVSNYASAIT